MWQVHLANIDAYTNNPFSSVSTRFNHYFAWCVRLYILNSKFFVTCVCVLNKNTVHNKHLKRKSSVATQSLICWETFFQLYLKYFRLKGQCVVFVLLWSYLNFAVHMIFRAIENHVSHFWRNKVMHNNAMWTSLCWKNKLMWNINNSRPVTRLF